MSSTAASAAIAGGASSWARAIVMISPYTFSAIGIAIAIGVSVLGRPGLYYSLSFSFLFYFYKIYENPNIVIMLMIGVFI
jgi:hypothetical protein